MTILIAPLMSCSARLPVYVLLIGAFVPATPIAGGVLNLQAVTLLGMYIVGAVVAVIVAWLLKRFVFKGPPPSFLMELPSYRIPSPLTVLYRMYEQGKEFVISAGTIIFACSIVIWALGYYPRPTSVAADHDAQRIAVEAEHARRLNGAAMSIGADVPGNTLPERPEVSAIMQELNGVQESFTTLVQAGGFGPGTEPWTALRDEADAALAAILARSGDAGEAARSILESAASRARRLDEIDRAQAGAYLRSSLLGRMGRWIEPIVRPLGWDWRIGTAVIASFPAREVIVATMGTIYNLGGDAEAGSVGLRDKLRSAKWPDGAPVFNVAVALSIMVFFALCCQCISTLAAIRRETRSWVWPLVTFSYMTGLAYVGAWVTYHVVGRLI